MATAVVDFTIVPGSKDPELRRGDDEGLIVGVTFDKTIMLYNAGPAESLTGIIKSYNASLTNYTVIAPSQDLDSEGNECYEQVLPSDDTVYTPGSVVYLAMIDGQWTITGLAVAQDLSTVTRARMQIRTMDGLSTLIAELDSSLTYPGSIYLNSGSVTGALRILLPATVTLTTGFANLRMYAWDVMFDYAGGVVSRPIMGRIRALSSVTLESVQT